MTRTTIRLSTAPLIPSPSEIIPSPRPIQPSQAEALRSLVCRGWMKHLSPSEFMVVMFVFDRTVGWGKLSERIRQSHFLGGVHGKDGATYHDGLSLSESTLYRTLSDLLSKRVMTREDGVYSLNFEWKPESNPDMIIKRSKKSGAAAPRTDEEAPEDGGIPPRRSFFADSEQDENDMPSILKKGKGPKKSSQNDRWSSQNDSSQDSQNDCHKEGIRKEGEKEESMTGSRRIVTRQRTRGASIEEVIASAATASTDKVAAARQRLDKASTGSARGTVKAKDLELVWTNAATASPGYRHILWTQKLSAIAKRRRRQWDGPFEELMEWAVDAWSAIMVSRFGWMTERPAPTIPDAAFFLSHFETFAKAYAEREKIDDSYRTVFSEGRKVSAPQIRDHRFRTQKRPPLPSPRRAPVMPQGTDPSLTPDPSCAMLPDDQTPRGTTVKVEW